MMKTRKFFLTALSLTAALLLASAYCSRSEDADSAQAHFRRATELKAQGNADAALNELILAAKDDPGNAAYRFQLGASYMEMDKLDEAVSELEAALKLNADSAETLKFLGLAYSKLGNHQKSLDAFGKALAISPTDAVLHNDAGQTSYMMKKLDEAENHLLKAIELDPKLTVAYVNLVNVYVEKDDFNKAVQTGEKAIALDPADSTARNNLSYAYFKQGNIEQAHAQMKKAVELQPENSNLAANLRYLDEKLEKRKKEAEQAAPADEKVAGMPREITLQEVQQKKQHEQESQAVAQAAPETPKAEQPATVSEQPAAVSEQPASTAPEAAPKQPRALKQEERAVAKQAPAPEPPAEKKIEAAAVQVPAETTPKPAPKTPRSLKSEPPATQKSAAPLKKEPKAEKPVAVAENKPSVETELSGYRKRGLARAEKEAGFTRKHYEKALVDVEKKDYDSARYHVNKALYEEPANADFKTLSAIIYDLQGFNNTAMTTLEEALSANPEHAVAFNALGHANQVLGRMEEAEADFEKARNLNPKNACATANNGSMKLLAGDVEMGHSLLRIALELGCRNAGTLNNLALARYLEGDDYGAVRLMRESVAEAPEHPVLVENAAFIKAKTPAKFEPITVELVHPKPFPPPSVEKPVTLDALVPVEPLRFYDFFEKHYQTKTVAVLPFSNQTGYRGSGEPPSVQMTRDLVGTLEKNQYFRIATDEEIVELAALSKQPELLRRRLEEKKIDLLVTAEPGKFMVEDRTKKKLYGLKKKNIVAGIYPFRLKIVETKTGEPVFDGDVAGEATLDNMMSYDVTVREKRDLKQRAFAEFCERVSRTLTDRYNLVTFAEPRGMVKYRVVRPEGDRTLRYQ